MSQEPPQEKRRYQMAPQPLPPEKRPTWAATFRLDSGFFDALWDRLQAQREKENERWAQLKIPWLPRIRRELYGPDSAQFIVENHDAVAFVVSQDGDVTAFVWEEWGESKQYASLVAYTHLDFNDVLNILKGS